MVISFQYKVIRRKSRDLLRPTVFFSPFFPSPFFCACASPPFSKTWRTSKQQGAPLLHSLSKENNIFEAYYTRLLPREGKLITFSICQANFVKLICSPVWVWEFLNPGSRVQPACSATTWRDMVCDGETTAMCFSHTLSFEISIG